MIRNNQYELDYLIRDANDLYQKYKDFAGTDKKTIALLLATLVLKQK